MKLKYNFDFMEMDGEQIAVPVGDNDSFHGILRVNDSTRAIMELLRNPITEDEIVASLLKIYESDEATIRRNVTKVLSTLYKENLLYQ